jgi:hypothetical protein
LKNYVLIALLCMVTVFALPARTQTSVTNLVMGAHWDDGSTIDGTVTIGKANVSGPDTVMSTRILNSGWTNVNELLGASSMYNVTLVTPTGTLLTKFPITTAFINPGNLKRAEIDLVFHKSDKSLKSAQISVNLDF